MHHRRRRHTVRVPSASNVRRIAAVFDTAAGMKWFRAPGRVNLMGDHTDYNEGFVLPFAIDRECVVAARPRADGVVRVRSLDVEQGADVVQVAADGSDAPSVVEPAWGRYVAGVVTALAERGRPAVGLEGVLASSVPRGSGLSSSAALEVGVALALTHVAGFGLRGTELALTCQRGEHLGTGVRSGVMDQLSSIAGLRGSALFIDCRSLATQPVRLPPDVGILVVHSGIPRTLAASAYAERRAGCEALAAELGVPALRDATLHQVRHSPLGRHVVTENGRVHETVRALADVDLRRVGRLFAASHASLRDDYAVSTPELDVLVAALVAAGAFGARLTGAGFGGSVVAVTRAHEIDAVAEAATTRYAAETGREPRPFACGAVDGAGVFSPTLN